MRVKAKTKFVRISPRKLNLVCDTVRGKDIAQAEKILKFSLKKGSGIISKCLESAVHNADRKKSIDVNTLYVKQIFCGAGPQLKRFLPRAMGRATKVLKRTSHLTVVLDER